MSGVDKGPCEKGGEGGTDSVRAAGEAVQADLLQALWMRRRAAQQMRHI